MDETTYSLFHRKRISERISGKEDAANNFAVGHGTIGNSLVDLETGGQLTFLVYKLTHPCISTER